MPFRHLLGRSAELVVASFISAGALLREPDADHESSLLLPGSEVPDGTRVGEPLDVFVYLDSDDRPIATLRTPALELGEVAFLEVRDVNDVGGFADWGLVKHLFIPFREQTTELRVGARHPFGLYVDPTGRLAGTMKIRELLKEQGEFQLDEWVEGEAWRKEPGVGVFVIVERAFVALIPEHEPTSLARGDRVRARVTNLLADGKLELSLRAHAHEEATNDARAILAALSSPNPPHVGDHSTPEEIRAAYNLSKKAFKRAIGGLLKRGEITIDAGGLPRVKRR